MQQRSAMEKASESQKEPAQLNQHSITVEELKQGVEALWIECESENPDTRFFTCQILVPNKGTRELPVAIDSINVGPGIQQSIGLQLQNPRTQRFAIPSKRLTAGRQFKGEKSASVKVTAGKLFNMPSDLADKSEKQQFTDLRIEQI